LIGAFGVTFAIWINFVLVIGVGLLLWTIYRRFENGIPKEEVQPIPVDSFTPEPEDDDSEELRW
jgi:hypothetical protein